MAHRHLSRSIALQSLYEWDFWGRDEAKLKQAVEKNIREFGPGIEDENFVRTLVGGVTERVKEIDDIIARCAPEWPLDQISVVDRNVLRVGIFELLWGNREEVPPKVAINEAIELGKNFGGENSGKFVNGVLGTIYREIGEPGKDYKKEEKNPSTGGEKPAEENKEQENR